ncbi:hypothetical protein Atc_0158 [Acidithiobacillus caldus SM-1]|uniref:Uncharacterized protein n=1 Tax=Acidithiobacillus caldus (strain SM-1) TaxID=990288 RepID=F9ZPI9_ACICS|nr:hypothetical protein Atc_0158 [Acidithiobacillus caldus SM-1]
MDPGLAVAARIATIPAPVIQPKAAVKPCVQQGGLGPSSVSR